MFAVLHLAPIVSALYLLQSEILSLQPSKCVPALTLSAITSRPTISSRPSKTISTSLCASESAGHCSRLQIILTYLFTLTYLLTDSVIWEESRVDWRVAVSRRRWNAVTWCLWCPTLHSSSAGDNRPRSPTSAPPPGRPAAVVPLPYSVSTTTTNSTHHYATTQCCSLSYTVNTTAATPASEIEVVRSPTNMAAANIAAVDFNKMTAKWRQSTVLLLAAMFVGRRSVSQSTASNASAVVIGCKKFREYWI